MDAIHAILLVCILVLTYIVVSKHCLEEPEPTPAPAAKTEGLCGVVISNMECPAPAAPMPAEPTPESQGSLGGLATEDKLAKINAENENFQSCIDSLAEVSSNCAESGSCNAGMPLLYAEYSYGAPDRTYNEYIMDEGVDSQVRQNHDEFTKDRKYLMKHSIKIVGPTQTYDQEISTDYIKWVGITGRPKGTPAMNKCSQQVADVPSDYFRVRREGNYLLRS
jgi:hypothetical protein